MVGRSAPMHLVVLAATTVAAPRHQRPELAGPMIVLNHYHMLLDCFVALPAFAAPQRYLAHPMLAHFVVVPIDLERSVALSDPMPAHFALLHPSPQVVLPGSPKNQIVAVARNLSLVCPMSAAVAVAPESVFPTHPAVVVLEFAFPTHFVTAPHSGPPTRSAAVALREPAFPIPVAPDSERSKRRVAVEPGFVRPRH